MWFRSQKLLSIKQAVVAISSILGENPIQIAESSTGYRWQMWSNIVTFFVEEATLNAWLWGVGRQNEIDIINFGMNTQFTQAHNQFLSWLAGGGVLGLCTVIFMCSTTIKNSLHQFPSFVFVVISGANISTNGPFYDIPHCVTTFVSATICECFLCSIQIQASLLTKTLEVVLPQSL
jgi:O-antigen ligase